MDVLFVTPVEEKKLNQEVNGTMLLATKLLQAGLDVQILRFCQAESYRVDYARFLEEMTEKICAAAPRCVSFYTIWPSHHIMLRLAAKIKQAMPQVITVLGGPQASATAEANMQSQTQIDYICTGEGELTAVPFFTAALAADVQAVAAVPGVYYRQDGQVCHNDQPVTLCDLDALPYWDDRLLLPDYDRSAWGNKHFFMPIDVGRGCPFSCTFCCSNRFWKRTYRLKSTQRLLDEIRYYRDHFGIRSFMFSHDAFTVDRKRVIALCDRLLEEKLDIIWKCTTRVNCVDEELLAKMKQAGLIGIELGVETGSERMQQIIQKKLDLKRVRELAKYMVQLGLHVDMVFMYGFPEETEADLNDTLQLQFDVLDMGVDTTSMSFCRFNPQTALTQQYSDQLVLDPEMKLLSRAVVGYQEELEVIAANKDIFPYFYHLRTPLRENYHYMCYFAYLYREFPTTGRYLRALFGGDNLRFYRTWCEKNPQLFCAGVGQLVRALKNNPLEVAENMLADLAAPKLRQVRALLQFEQDIKVLKKTAGDRALRKTYDFSYLDLQRKRDLDQLKDVSTEMLLSKTGNQIAVRTLGFREYE